MRSGGAAILTDRSSAAALTGYANCEDEANVSRSVRGALATDDDQIRGLRTALQRSPMVSSTEK